MKTFLRKSICILLVSLVLILTGCTSTTIQSYSDELVSSLWSAKLDNGTQIMLIFEDDKATLKMSSMTIKLKYRMLLNISCILTEFV